MFLLALAAEVFAGTVVFSSLFTWLVVVSLFGLFFYSFAVFCAMFTGHVLALPAFYVVLNGLAAGLCWVFSRMAEEFLFGFTSAAWLEKLGVWLTPVLLLSEACHVQYDIITDAAGNSMLGDPYFAGLGYASLYALIGLVLAYEQAGTSAAFWPTYGFNALTVGLGEVVACYGLGMLLLWRLSKSTALQNYLKNR